MSLRRRPQPDKVREVIVNAPPGIVAAEYAEEIIRLRGAIKQGLTILERGDNRAVVEARCLLRDTLEREGWWK